MSLTREEEAERRRLRRLIELEDDREKGDQHLEKVAAAKPPPPSKERKFSLYRVTVGGLRDAAQGLIDTVGDLAGYTAREDVQLGQFSQNPLTGLPGGGVVGSALDLVKRTRPGRTIAGTVSASFAPGSVGRKATTLPTLEGEENAGVAERVLRGLTSYAIPFTGYAKAVGIARGATWLGRAGRGMLAGAAVDFTQDDPVSGNIANALRDGFGLKSDVLDALAAEDDDDALETRFRAAAVGAPVGLLGDAAFEVGSKAIRAYRAWKGTADEAAATVEALKKDIKLDPKARDLPAPLDKAGQSSNGPTSEGLGTTAAPIKTGEEITGTIAGKQAPAWVDEFKPAADATPDDLTTPKKFVDAAQEQGVRDATAVWFLDGDKPVYMSADLSATGRRAAEFEKYESISKEGVTVWFKPGEADRARRLLRIANNYSSDPNQILVNFRVQGRLLGYHPDSVEAYVARRAQSFREEARAGAGGSGSPPPPPGSEGATSGAEPGRGFDPETDIRPDAETVTDFEDVLDYLKRNADAPDINEADAARFAENLLFGDPENALAKLGIDPAKLDFSKFDDPDMLGRLQKGMAELYETYASKLGRSNLRITEAATASAARSLASTADVLKSVHGSTSNLAEELMGARMFVGAHAHKLLALADEAAAEIVGGGAGTKWAEFLEAFHRHAYYLGALRGAGSEVGRALRSLQTLAKVSKPKAAKTVTDALEAEAVSTGRAVAENRVVQGASEFAERLVTDAEKLEALARLTSLGGDVGELSRHVRRENMSILRRLDGALKETVGNLFSTGTAIYNLASGATMLGTRVLERSMSTMARLALAPLGGKEAGAAARLAVLDTWAFTHGLISGFAPAYRRTLDVLEKEGGSELALNFDTLGLHKLAVEAAERSNAATGRLGASSFERADVKSYRNLAILPSEWRAMQEAARSLPGPAFFQEGLAAFARRVAGTTNVVGSLSRLGTILFINLPDQFIGTMAAQAGAYSFAVRTAAKEAAELGLDGRELSEYLKARTIQLADHSAGWSDDGFDAGAREAMAAAGEVEARAVLFQDDLELAFTRGIERTFTSPGWHILAPFVRTPLRILERTAIDYTPLGLLKDRIRKAIVAGGPERDEALARLSLSMVALGLAYDLAEDRTIVGNDGGYTSSARMTRSSYSLKIGDDAYEFNRIDPLGTVLGFGADLRAYKEAAVDDPDADEVMAQATEAFIWGIAANVLSKTWLTSLGNLADLAGATSDEDASARLDQFIQSFGNRAVPASGIQRQITAAGDGFLHQAMSFSDQAMKASIGSPTLPLRRDALMGRPIPMEGFNRIIGIRGGPTASEVDDPLAAEMERLSFKVPGSRRTVEGVKLTAAQYSRLLELKGQIVRNPSTGLTLEETLETLIGLPEYASMADAARVQAIRDEMAGFSRLAVDQLLREDKGFAYKVLRQEVFDTNALRGGNRNDAESEVQRLARELGLQPSP